MEQLDEKINDYAATLQHLQRRIIQQYRSRCENYAVQLRYVSPVNRIRRKRDTALAYEEQLGRLMERKISDKRHQLALLIEQLKGLSPLDKLNQGYAYVADADGNTLTSVQKVRPGDPVQIYVKDGRINASVEKISREPVLLEQGGGRKVIE